MERPPCWPKGRKCPNPCAWAHYRREVWNLDDFGGHWRGWKLRGVALVNPHGERVSVQALDRLMYRQARFR